MLISLRRCENYLLISFHNLPTSKHRLFLSINVSSGDPLPSVKLHSAVFRHTIDLTRVSYAVCVTVFLSEMSRGFYRLCHGACDSYITGLFSTMSRGFLGVCHWTSIGCVTKFLSAVSRGLSAVSRGFSQPCAAGSWPAVWR